MDMFLTGSLWKIILNHCHMGIVFESSKIIKCLHILKNAGIFNAEHEEQKKSMYPLFGDENTCSYAKCSMTQQYFSIYL